MDLSDVRSYDALDARAARQLALMVAQIVSRVDADQASEIARFGRSLTDDPQSLMFHGLIGMLQAVCGADPAAGEVLSAAGERAQAVRDEAVESRRTWEKLTPAQRAEVTS